MTGSTEWGVLRLGPENTMVGAHNLSKEPPIKRAGFGIGRESFANIQQYVDWEFRFVPGMTGAAAPSGTAPPRAP